MKKLLMLLMAAPLMAATGDITAIRVIGSTTGVSGTALSACLSASACTGWVAEIDVSGLSTGGTYALGIGANNSPAAAKIACTVTSSGYNAAGSLGTMTRTVYGTHQLRKIYDAGHTAPYPNDETVVSSTLTLRVALSDALYSGDTASCDVGAGIYTQGGTPTNAATGVTVTNNSTLTYSQARVIANWSWPGWTRITGNSLTVRAVGFHRHGKNGKPLAAMKFTATDGTHTATATVTDMTIDANMSSDAVKVQEYVGTLDLTGFTQGALVTVNFAAYPWVGDSTSVMDTSDGTNTMPTPLYAPQYYIFDAAGTFGTAAAVVDGTSGVDATCVAVSEATFDANPNSNSANTSPCLTILGAAKALRVFNAANYGSVHSDEAGSIWVKAGTYTWAGGTSNVSASSGTLPDKIWTEVKPFPGVAKTDVVINGSTTVQRFATAPIKVSGIKVNVSSGAPTQVFTAQNYIWLHGNDLTMTSGSGLVYGNTATAIAYYTQNTVVSDGSCGTGGSSATCVKSGFTQFSSTAPAVLIRGNTLTGLTHTLNVYTFLGNVSAPTVSNTGLQIRSPETAIPVISTAPILAYNKLMNLQTSSATVVSLVGSLSSALGVAFIQNVLEVSTANTTIPMTAASDASTNTPVNNIMAWHNTIAGNRINRCYNDNGSTLRLRTLWSDIGNLYDATAMKHDTFATVNAARVGAWACLYGVGWRGNMDVGAPVFAQRGQWQPEFAGLSSDYIAVGASRDEQATYQVPRGTGRANTYPGFISRASYDGSSTGAGNGDYHIGATSPARNLIPSSGAVLPYDLDGKARRNDGTGAAGAYESDSATKRRAGVVVQ